MSLDNNPKDTLSFGPSITSNLPSRKSTLPPPSLPRDWFPTPGPIRRLFAQFPLQTLPPNYLPATRDTANTRQGSSISLPSLYIFASSADASSGAPSFNPTCLKWQVWLRICGVQTRVISSSNHASPTGALPFVMPANGADGTAKRPVSGARLYEWALEQGQVLRQEKRKTPDIGALEKAREEAYLNLIEHRVRAAWLHALYFTSNFGSIIYPLYVASSSSASPIRLSLSRSLKTAARKQLHQLSPRTSPPLLSGLSVSLNSQTEDKNEEEAKLLYKAAAEAFRALATLLGDDEWFFGAAEPGILDASLFSYTHLLLDEDTGDGWADTRLRRGLIEHSNLVRHRKRLYKLFFV